MWSAIALNEIDIPLLLSLFSMLNKMKKKRKWFSVLRRPKEYEKFAALDWRTRIKFLVFSLLSKWFSSNKSSCHVNEKKKKYKRRWKSRRTKFINYSLHPCFANVHTHLYFAFIVSSFTNEKCYGDVVKILFYYLLMNLSIYLLCICVVHETVEFSFHFCFSSCTVDWSQKQ